MMNYMLGNVGIHGFFPNELKGHTILISHRVSRRVLTRNKVGLHLFRGNITNQFAKKQRVTNSRNSNLTIKAFTHSICSSFSTTIVIISNST